MTTNDLAQTVFAGRYRLERKLGSGGMADVWLAEDQELGRRVAVKILHERYANDEQFVERFRREATHAAGLSHPNIVSIFDRGVADGSYYIVMEYVEGRTLKELIVKRGPCPVPVALSYTRQILAALRYAHRNGIIHRDIKPHNVIVDREGRAKVADFGIARAGASEMTEAGSIVGTAQYLSPEQARGAPVDESSDLYSTGVVLFELLTGTVPFAGETPVEIAMKHLSHTPEVPSAKRPEVTRDLDLVVLRALAKETSERYRNAAEMDRDLELLTRGEPVGTETETAATMVLAGVGALDQTTATRLAPRAVAAGGAAYAGEERYRAYEGGVARRRAWWPWLLGLGALLALAVAGYFVYGSVQNQIAAGRPVPVDDYVGIVQRLAVANIKAAGFGATVRTQPNATTPAGTVFRQDPSPGTRLAKGSVVTIFVSTGKPTVSVPDVVGMQLADAVATITRAGLKAVPADVFSEKPAGTVTAQAPKAGGPRLLVGSSVRINVSTGPKPVGVPSVTGLLYETAAAQLQTGGFAVARVPVDSTEPAGVVVDQSPAGNATAPKGSKVTLSVSNGPKTTPLPDVSGQKVADAKATLQAAGFKITLQPQDTDVQSFDGVVISQDPPGATQQDPKTIVTLFVGRYVPPTTTAPTDTVPTTPTDTTGTVPTTPTDTTGTVPTTPTGTTTAPPAP